MTAVSPSTVRTRLSRGWSEAEAANTPRFGNTVTAQCREAGISRTVYYERRRRGMSNEAALGGADVNRLLRPWKPPHVGSRP